MKTDGLNGEERGDVQCSTVRLIHVSSHASAAKAYFKNHGIEYMEQAEDGYYVGSFYVFKFPAMTKEQLEMATKYTEVKFYQ